MSRGRKALVKHHKARVELKLQLAWYSCWVEAMSTIKPRVCIDSTYLCSRLPNLQRTCLRSELRTKVSL